MSAKKSGRPANERGPQSGQVVAGSSVAGDVIQIGDVTGNVTVLLERSSFRLELLQPVGHVDLPERVRRQPSYLLHPKNQVVPYRPPVDDLATLAKWRDGRGDLSVLLMYGPGGQGKTRTAQHFASRALVDGWLVAQARDLSTTAPELPHADGTAPDRLLVVVDYAERWQYKNLLEMLESARGAARARVVRVLLLARSDTHLWDQLEAELDGSGVAYAAPVALTGFVETSRQTLFAEAASAFARALALPVEVPTMDHLDDPQFASPLTLHMAALAAVVAANQEDERPADVSQYLLLHEQRHWNASSPADVVRAVVVLATLFGPARTPESARALLIAAGVADGRAEADRALKRHQSAYPSDRYLTPLRPDRFAEDFLSWHLGRDRNAGADLTELMTRNGGSLQPADLRQGLIVLANAARHESVRQLLGTVIARRPDLAESSPAVMLAVADHLDFATAVRVAVVPSTSVELTYARLRLTERIAHEIPDEVSTVDEQARLWLLGRRLLDFGNHAQAAEVFGRAVRFVQEHPDSYDVTALDRADLLNVYAEALAGCGRSSEAVRVMADAVDLVRQVPSDCTAGETQQYLEMLARSLTNQSNALSAAGDNSGGLVAAEEAVELYTTLADDDATQFGPALTQAEGRVGSLLRDLGRSEDAVSILRRAADGLRWLFADDPDAHRASYADALFNVALGLRATGRATQAAAALSDAAELYRYLAQHIPLHYLERLGGCLYELSSVLEELDRTGEMIRILREQVVVERQLQGMQSEPDDRRFAITMSELGQQLGMLEDYVHAEPALSQAVSLFRGLEADYPDAVDQVLPGLLVMLSVVQVAIGQRPAAQDAAREAVMMSRRRLDGTTESAIKLTFALQQLASCLPDRSPERMAVLTELAEFD